MHKNTTIFGCNHDYFSEYWTYLRFELIKCSIYKSYYKFNKTLSIIIKKGGL